MNDVLKQMLIRRAIGMSAAWLLVHGYIDAQDNASILANLSGLVGLMMGLFSCGLSLYHSYQHAGAKHALVEALVETAHFAEFARIVPASAAELKPITDAKA